LGGGAWGRREGVRVSSGDPRVMGGCMNLKYWKLVGKKLLEAIQDFRTKTRRRKGFAILGFFSLLCRSVEAHTHGGPIIQTPSLSPFARLTAVLQIADPHEGLLLIQPEKKRGYVTMFPLSSETNI
jgi:hypothetical protein